MRKKEKGAFFTFTLRPGASPGRAKQVIMPAWRNAIPKS
jgi:hypothetical protein